MNKHLSFRSGNPALNSKVFKGFSKTSGELMTLNGTVNKTGLSLLILIVCAGYTYQTANTNFIFVDTEKKTSTTSVRSPAYISSLIK